MGDELFTLLGTDPDDPHVRAATEDARDAERLIDTLVQMRTSLGVTQAQVAGRMETTQSAVSKFERAGGDPRLSTVQRYARAIGGRLRCVVTASSHEGEVWKNVSYPVAAAIETDPGSANDRIVAPSITLVA